MEVSIVVGVSACTARVIAAAVYTSCKAASGVAEAVPEQAESSKAHMSKKLNLEYVFMIIEIVGG